MKTSLTISELITVMVEMEAVRDQQIDRFRKCIMNGVDFYISGFKDTARTTCRIVRKLNQDIGITPSPYTSDLDQDPEEE